MDRRVTVQPAPSQADLGSGRTSAHGQSSGRGRGFRFKFIAAAAATLIVTLSAAVWLDIRSEEQDYVKHIKNSAGMLGRFVSLVSPEPILGNDFVTLNAYMEEISRQEDIVSRLRRGRRPTRH